jgi:hypothetical protein
MTIAVSSRGISKLCRSYQCHITDPLETWRIAKVLNREQQASRRFHDEVVGGVEL